MDKQEIIDLASRYVSVDRADFPLEGDLFYFRIREVPENRILKEDEGWKFSGYGQLVEYIIDAEAKPLGKWIFMFYLDLTKFPLEENSLRLQPPHITQGLFHSETRTHQISIVKCGTRKFGLAGPGGEPADQKAKTGGAEGDNIIPFPSRKD